jgi:hypothetical protein
MAHSIYEIDDYQDVAKPSDLLGENDYTQDVFFQTRPEVFDFNDNSTENNDSNRNPYFRERDRDEEQKGEMYFNEFLYNKSPSNFENRDDYLVKKSDKISKIVAEYLIENHPVQIKLFEKENKKNAVSIAELVRSTSDYSKKYVRGVNVKFLFSDRKNIKYYFRAKGFEPWSSETFHNVILQFEKNPKIKDLRAVDVKISCDCPFWQYQGPDFNAQKENYLEGLPKSKGEPSDKSSLSKNKICKHVSAVREHIDKWLIKSNLDTYREVGTIIDNLDKIKDSYGVDNAIKPISDIYDKLKGSDQKNLIPILRSIRIDKQETSKINKYENLLDNLKEVLDYQDKNFLKKIINDFKNIPLMLKKKKEEEEKIENKKVKDKTDPSKNNSFSRLLNKVKNFIEDPDESFLNKLKLKVREIVGLPKKNEQEIILDLKKFILDEKKDISKQKNRKEKKNRRQRNLKRIIKKSSLINFETNKKVASIIELYLKEIGEKNGEL